MMLSHPVLLGLLWSFLIHSSNGQPQISSQDTNKVYAYSYHFQHNGTTNSKDILRTVLGTDPDFGIDPPIDQSIIKTFSSPSIRGFFTKGILPAGPLTQNYNSGFGSRYNTNAAIDNIKKVVEANLQPPRDISTGLLPPISPDIANQFPGDFNNMNDIGLNFHKQDDFPKIPPPPPPIIPFQNQGNFPTIPAAPPIPSIIQNDFPKIPEPSLPVNNDNGISRVENFSRNTADGGKVEGEIQTFSYNPPPVANSNSNYQQNSHGFRRNENFVNNNQEVTGHRTQSYFRQQFRTITPNTDTNSLQFNNRIDNNNAGNGNNNNQWWNVLNVLGNNNNNNGPNTANFVRKVDNNVNPGNNNNNNNNNQLNRAFGSRIRNFNNGQNSHSNYNNNLRQNNNNNQNNNFNNPSTNNAGYRNQRNFNIPFSNRDDSNHFSRNNQAFTNPQAPNNGFNNQQNRHDNNYNNNNRITPNIPFNNQINNNRHPNAQTHNGRPQIANNLNNKFNNDDTTKNVLNIINDVNAQLNNLNKNGGGGNNNFRLTWDDEVSPNYNNDWSRRQSISNGRPFSNAHSGPLNNQAAAKPVELLKTTIEALVGGREFPIPSIPDINNQGGNYRNVGGGGVEKFFGMDKVIEGPNSFSRNQQRGYERNFHVNSNSGYQRNNQWSTNEVRRLDAQSSRDDFSKDFIDVFRDDY